jgi:uncharacterized membrane protein YhaH (DUF805 family)
VLFFKNLFSFKGRARRKEYFLSSIVLFLTIIMFMSFFKSIGEIVHSSLYSILFIAFVVAVLVSELALTVRRIHDVGRSGWFIFILLIPIIGWIWGLILTLSEGDGGKNKYGLDPKDDGISTIRNNRL